LDISDDLGELPAFKLCSCGGWNPTCFKCNGSGSTQVRTLEQIAREAERRVQDAVRIREFSKAAEWNIEHGWKFEVTARRDLFVRLVSLLARRRDFLMSRGLLRADSVDKCGGP
jgi:hypothetical protein